MGAGPSSASPQDLTGQKLCLGQVLVPSGCGLDSRE